MIARCGRILELVTRETPTCTGYVHRAARVDIEGMGEVVMTLNAEEAERLRGVERVFVSIESVEPSRG